jgi:hypothetical protein
VPGLGVPAGALTRQQGALKQMRGAINDALEEQVPGGATANRVSAALAQRGEAVNLGTQYLARARRLRLRIASPLRSTPLSRAKRSHLPRAAAVRLSATLAPRRMTSRPSAASVRA